MKPYIDKSALVAEIDNWIEFFTNKKNEEGISQINKVSFVGRITELQGIKDFIDTLEVKEIGVDLGDPQGDIGVNWAQEEPVSNDLEDYAHKESESFAEREYEIDYIDRNALAKGYYWGVKAGAQWQKEQIIDKACEWLREHKECPFIGCEDPCLSGYLTDGFIEEFKKAMEE